MDFLNTVDQNDVRLPVAKYLASQRASSIQTLVTYLMVVRSPHSFAPSDLPSALPTGGLRPGTKCGAGFLASEFAWRNRHVFLLWIADRKATSTAAALVCLSCFVAWGFGFCRTGLWARPRPGALGGALVMPRKIWSGPALPPPKFPGAAMESCLFLAPGNWE